VQRQWKAVGTYGSVGLEFAFCSLLGLFAGRWLDGKFGTGPWLALVGLVLGVAAGYRGIWRALKEATREAERQEQADQQARKSYHDRPNRDS
jgi:ATP synthase protein I